MMNNTDSTPTINQNNTVIPNGYKKTAIGIIPIDWEVKRLGEIAKVKHGRDQKKVEDINGLYPILGTGGIIGKTNEYLYDKPSVLIGRKGTIDKPKYMDTPFWTVDTLFYTELVLEINPLWLFNFFQTIDWYYYNQATGVPSLSASVISAIKLPLPPLSEQQKIAEILSTWDDAIATCKKTIDRLKDRNKGLSQHLLTGKKRLNGFNDIWEETLLKKVIIEHKVKSSTENQYEVLTSSKKGLIKQSEYYNKGRIIDKENKGFNVIPEGFITYRSRSDDSIFTFNQNKFNFTGIVSTYYPVFEFKNCNNNYLVKLLNLNSLKIGRYSVGTSQLVLSLNELKQIKLSFPQIKEQNAIVEVLDIAEKELNSYETKLEAFQLQKKGLMQQLLTGKIRVNVK